MFRFTAWQGFISLARSLAVRFPFNQSPPAARLLAPENKVPLFSVENPRTVKGDRYFCLYGFPPKAAELLWSGIGRSSPLYETPSLSLSGLFCLRPPFRGEGAV